MNMTFKAHGHNFELHIDTDYAYGFPMAVYSDDVRYDWTSQRPTVAEAIVELFTHADFQDFLVSPRASLEHRYLSLGALSPSDVRELGTGGST